MTRGSPRPIIVILGLDPGIQADSVGWGDPRITSGDDEDKKSCLHLAPYPDANGANPRSPGHSANARTHHTGAPNHHHRASRA
jgi:hypothetical protein